MKSAREIMLEELRSQEEWIDEQIAELRLEIAKHEGGKEALRHVAARIRSGQVLLEVKE